MELLKYLAVLEHLRWSRYLFNHGNVYSSSFYNVFGPYKGNVGNDFDIYKEYGFEDPREYAKAFLKLHNCLVPYSYKGQKYLPEYYEPYDYGNAIFPSIKNEKNKEKKSQ